MNWIRNTPEGCAVTVKATPRASRSEIGAPEGEWLRVRLQAPPVDGKANEALVALFASALGVPKRSVTLLSGETSRVKRVLLRGLTAEAVLAALP